MDPRIVYEALVRLEAKMDRIEERTRANEVGLAKVYTLAAAVATAASLLSAKLLALLGIR